MNALRLYKRVIMAVVLLLFGALLLAGYWLGPDKTLQPPPTAEQDNRPR